MGAARHRQRDGLAGEEGGVARGILGEHDSLRTTVISVGDLAGGQAGGSELTLGELQRLADHRGNEHLLLGGLALRTAHRDDRESQSGQRPFLERYVGARQVDLDPTVFVDCEVSRDLGPHRSDGVRGSGGRLSRQLGLGRGNRVRQRPEEVGGGHRFELLRLGNVRDRLLQRRHPGSERLQPLIQIRHGGLQLRQSRFANLSQSLVETFDLVVHNKSPTFGRARRGRLP